MQPDTSDKINITRIKGNILERGVMLQGLHPLKKVPLALAMHQILDGIDKHPPNEFELLFLREKLGRKSPAISNERFFSEMQADLLTQEFEKNFRKVSPEDHALMHDEMAAVLQEHQLPDVDAFLNKIFNSSVMLMDLSHEYPKPISALSNSWATAQTRYCSTPTSPWGRS